MVVLVNILFFKMVGQNFFNYVDFMVDKLIFYISQLQRLSNSPLTNRKLAGLYSTGSTAWCCNYRERPNDTVIDNNFVFGTQEKNQRWSGWKYGLPVTEVSGLVYVPRKFPELEYLGQSFTYNPRSEVFFFHETGQDISKMAREFTDIGNIDKKFFGKNALAKYFIFKKNKYIPPLTFETETFDLSSGERYNVYSIKNDEFYTAEDRQLLKDFEYPKLRWSYNNEFLLYYEPIADTAIADDHKYIVPTKLITKVNTPRLFSGYDLERDGLVSKSLLNYRVPDFDNNKVVIKNIPTSLKTINSCYIPSNDGSKIFEIVTSRLFFRFTFERFTNRPENVIWEVDTKLENLFLKFRNAKTRDKAISSTYKKQTNIDELLPSRFRFPLSLQDKNYLNSLAIMEHIPAPPEDRYVEPFMYQPGTLPGKNKWSPSDLEQIGGYPKGIAPTSVVRTDAGIDYNFDFEITKKDGNFEPLPNPKNKSTYSFRNFNIVPTSELIL